MTWFGDSIRNGLAADYADYTDRNPCNPRNLRLKNVLQGELQNAWFKGVADLPKGVAAQSRGITGPDAATDGWRACNPTPSTSPGALHAARTEAIGHVKSFRSNFQPLCLAKVESPRQRHIKRPRARAN